MAVELYGYEKWPCKISDECTLKFFENKTLRRIFESKMDEDRDWRRLHNEELHGFYLSTITVRNITSKGLKWTRHLARIEEGRYAFKILTVGNTVKKPLGRPRHRWKDNFKMDLNK